MSGFWNEDMVCTNSECGHEVEGFTFDFRGIDTPEGKAQAMKDQLPCPACGSEMTKAYNKAVRVGYGSDEKSPVQFERMKQSFRQRFYKKEIDDIRHEHGTAIDDSIRAGNIKRIKNGEKPI